MTKPVWRTIGITQKQAKSTLRTLQTLMSRAEQFAEIAHIDYELTHREILDLAELRRKLVLASMEENVYTE